MPKLFTPGPATDATFQLFLAPQNNRIEQARVFLEECWLRYAGYADPDFPTKIRDEFHARVWEMLLTCALLEHASRLDYVVRPSPTPGKGPDVLLECHGKRVWIEAVVATDGQEVNVPGTSGPTTSAVRPDEIILRITNAVQRKQEAYLVNLEKGRLAADDCYVIAVNGRSLKHSLFDHDPPWFLRAVLPIGENRLIFDPGLSKIVGEDVGTRHKLTKPNGADIPTDGFLSAKYGRVSAVLYSITDSFSQPPLGQDFQIAHNPLAVNPLTGITLPSWKEWRSVIAEERVTVSEGPGTIG